MTDVPNSLQRTPRPEHIPEAPTGREVRPGELLPAMAIKTPTKPVPFVDRNKWARLPAKFGGRGGFRREGADGTPSYGTGLGETSRVPGVDGVPGDAAGWRTDVGGGNGEFPLSRSPIKLARLALCKERTPVRRWRRDDDGMGG